MTMTLQDLDLWQHFTDIQGRHCVFMGMSPDGTWASYYYNNEGTWVVTDDALDTEIQGLREGPQSKRIPIDWEAKSEERRVRVEKIRNEIDDYLFEGSHE